MGSLIDCLADRSLTGESFWGRSYCTSCKKQLKWYDLFPVFSYLFSRGKCRYCHKKIPLECLLIELLMGGLTAYLFYLNVPADFLTIPPVQLSLIGIDVVFKLFVMSVLVAVLITDIKSGLIPDRITYPGVIIAFVFLLAATAYKIYIYYQSLLQSPLGKYLLPPHSDFFLRHAYIIATPLLYSIVAAFIIGLFFLVLILATRGRGMGGGDMKLGVFLGIGFGFPQSLLVLVLAFLSGSIIGILLLLSGKKKLGHTIPFGPFLSLGGILSLFWGEKILNWYLNLKYFS